MMDPYIPKVEIGMKKHRFERVKISEIENIDGDWKETDVVTHTKLKHSILEYGILSPVVLANLDGKLYTVDGVRRIMVAYANGLDEVPAHIIDVSSENELLFVRITLTNKWFDYDVVKFIFAMHKVMETFSIENIEGVLPYTQVELENFKELFDFDWNQFSKGGPVKKVVTPTSKLKALF